MTTNFNDGFTQTLAVGGETTIDFDFLIYAAEDIEVIKTAVDGTISTLSLGPGYTVGAGELNNEAGGVIGLVVAAVAGERYTCLSNIQESRSSDFQQGGDFYAATINRNLDRLTRIGQQHRRDIDKKIGLAQDSNLSGIFIEDPTDGAVQYYEAASNSFVNGPSVADISAAATSASEAAASAISAAASAASALESAESLFGVSFSSVTIGTGLKSFQTDANRIFLQGTWLIAVEAGGTSYVHGQVSSYNSSTGALVLNVTNVQGAGTYAAWVIIISGTVGPPGNASALVASAVSYNNVTSGLSSSTVQGAIDEIAAGAASFTVNGATTITAAATNDFLVLSDTSDSNLNKKITVANFLKVVNDLTEDVSPDSAADFLMTFDTSAGAVKKSLISSVLAALAGGIADVQFFTSSGTWTKAAGVTKALVIAIGGGGAGAGASNGSPVAGGAGGTTQFGSHCSATGGAGGSAASSYTVGATGGVGSGGDLNIQGGAGSCSTFSQSNTQSINIVILPGPGGSSVFGGGGASGNSTTAGAAGGNYGAGGGGGYAADLNNTPTAPRAGGGSGAGGGCAIKWITSALGSTESVTIGAAGARSAAPSAAFRGGNGAAGCVLVMSFR